MELVRGVVSAHCEEHQEVLLRRNYLHKSINCSDKAVHILLWVVGLFLSILFAPIAVYGLIKWSLNFSDEKVIKNDVTKENQVQTISNNNNIIDKEKATNINKTIEVQDNLKSDNRLNVFESKEESSNQETSFLNTLYDIALSIYFSPGANMAYYKCKQCFTHFDRKEPVNIFACIIGFFIGVSIMSGVIYLLNYATIKNSK